MAKYDVTFSCGHTQEIELLGKEKDRRRKIEYFERVGLCRACYFGQTRKKGARLGFPVKFAGKWYQLISDATTADASTEYYAYAMSWGDVDDENEYIVTWQVKKEWLEMDEKERMMSMLLKKDIVAACDWETSVKITIRNKKKGGRVNG